MSIVSQSSDDDFDNDDYIINSEEDTTPSTLGIKYLIKFARYVRKALRGDYLTHTLMYHVLSGINARTIVVVSFLVSFIIDWIHLYYKKWNQHFDKFDKKKNVKAYWELVKRSFTSNIATTACAVTIAAVFGIVTFEGIVATIFCVCTCVGVGWLIKFGMKCRAFMRDRTRYSNALHVMKYKHDHKTLTQLQLENRKTQLLIQIRTDIGSNSDDAINRKAELADAYATLKEYLSCRDDANGLMMAGVEAYMIFIKEQERRAPNSIESQVNSADRYVVIDSILRVFFWRFLH